VITGATLINDTLEDLLALARPDTRIPCWADVGMLPDAFLARAPTFSARSHHPADGVLDSSRRRFARHFLGARPRYRWATSPPRQSRRP